MRSLFLKMFLWFCGTTGAVLLVIIVGFLRESPTAVVTNWRDLGQRAIVVAAERAAEIYEQDGRAAVSRYLFSLAKGLGIRTVLLDEAGRDLTGGGMVFEPELLDRLRTGGRDELTILSVRGLAGVLVRGPLGGEYLFVAILPPRESGIWGRMFLVLFLAAGGVLCYLLARYITSPVANLRTLTRQFSQGDLGARVTSPGVLERRDEIGELARDFNRMAARIEDLMQAQRRLIADVSHELRSPITRLSLALGLMRRRAEPGDRPSLARMEREVERLNSLISQLLTLSRLEYLDLPVPKEPFDLGGMVQEVAADADFEATNMNRGVRLARCEPCSMRGAPDLVRSAIENVVRNAVKYTDPNTQVSVELLRAEDGRTATVVVQDHGPGLPEPELAHVFEPFYRVDAARDRQTGGVGLGLAITEQVVTLHGGRASARNLESGGLEFRITLPVDG